jgi:multiple sugar transport system permease protein
LLTAIAGGSPPDLVWFDRFAVGEWAARGAFKSLQPFYEKDLKEKPDDPLTLRKELFYDPCWVEANYEGNLYAIPAITDNRCLYYNIDLLEKYSSQLIPIGCVDPNDPTKVGPPRTWDQLKKCAEILTQRDSAGQLVRVGFIPNFGNSYLYIYGWLNGGSFMTQDGRTCTMDEPAIVDALVYMTEVYDVMGGVESVNAFQSTLQNGDMDPFLGGKVAMKIDANPFLSTIANQRRDMRFGVAPAPAPEGKSSIGWSGGHCWVIPSGAKHQEEAWEYLKYLSSLKAYKVRADGNYQIAKGGGNVYMPELSARKDITNWSLSHYLDDDPNVDDKFKIAMHTFVDRMPYSQSRPVTPVGQILWNAQLRAMEAGIYKRYDKTDLKRNAQIALTTQKNIVQVELDHIYKPAPHPVMSFKPVVITYVALLLFGLIWMYVHFDRKVQASGYFRREFYAGYLFAIPWFLGFLIFGGGPILFSLFMSFCDYDVFSAPKFVGVENFTTMFLHDPLFYKSLWNTLFMALGVPLSMAISLGMAMLLNYEVKGMAVYRTFFYLPAIMPAVAASILWIWIFNPHGGVINSALAVFGIPGPSWLHNQHWSKPALMLMGLWSAGGGMIIWLAGLKGIPTHLYEAAKLDGAGRLRMFWNITLPMLSPYILFNFIMGLISTFQIFTPAFIMTQGGPVDSTRFYAYLLFDNAFRYMKMGYASALAWILFGIILLLTVIQLRLSKRWVHYESEI